MRGVTDSPVALLSHRGSKALTLGAAGRSVPLSAIAGTPAGMALGGFGAAAAPPGRLDDAERRIVGSDR